MGSNAFGVAVQNTWMRREAVEIAFLLPCFTQQPRTFGGTTYTPLRLRRRFGHQHAKSGIARGALVNERCQHRGSYMMDCTPEPNRSACVGETKTERVLGNEFEEREWSLCAAFSQNLACAVCMAQRTRMEPLSRRFGSSDAHHSMIVTVQMEIINVAQSVAGEFQGKC